MEMVRKTKQDTYGDKGGASRFSTVPRPSKSERNAGLEDTDIEKKEKRVNKYAI